MAIVVSVSGMKGVQDLLKKADVKLQKDLSNEINASALNIQTNAKKLAPVNFGNLRNNIVLEKASDYTFSVESKASYSPYLEFGTGSMVSVPSSYEDYAIQFKGKQGGSFKEFIEALMLWIKRKGIGNGKNEKGLAYVIARKILQKGIRPQPFLIPSFEQEKPKLLENIKKLINA